MITAIRFPISFFVATALNLFVASGAVVGGNSLTNGGFEAELDSWRVAHAGGDDPDASYAVTTGVTRGGSHCLAYRKTAGASRNTHCDQVIEIDSEGLYTLSAWVRSDGTLTPLLSVEDIGWKPLASAKATESALWHRIGLTFPVRRPGSIRIIWYGGSKGKRYQSFQGESWLDDVELRRATEEEVVAYEARRHTPKDNWFPFPLRWDDTILSPHLMTGLLHDAPAGKHGFVQSRDGHLFFPNGQRAKFWGVCLCGPAALPSHEQAEIVAARLVKCGVNMVRLHALETRIFDAKFNDSAHLDPEMLDRLDYFIAQLKQRGIYIFMDWRTAWRVLPNDGLAPRKLYQWSMLDPRFQKLNDTYAKKLYLHRNPYTGNRLVDEPAIAVFEIVNERDIFTLFTGRHKDDPDTARIREQLQARWNRWLAARYRTREDFAKAWTSAAGACGLGADEDPSQDNVLLPLPAHALGRWDRDNTPATGPSRASDTLLFLYELQTEYFKSRRAELRELGVRVPISGTNWHMTIRPNAKSNFQLDFTENHSYWDHAQPWPPGRDCHTRTRNEPLVSVSPATGGATIIDRLACGKAPDRPFIVSEYNFDSPNEYRCEGPIAMAAYGSLQDWDAIICYCFYGGWSRWWDQISEADELGMYLGSEEIFNDPAILCQFPIAAAIFLRGDVQPANVAVDIGYCHTDTFFAQGRWGEESRHLRFLPFVHRVRHAYFDRQYAGDADVAVASGLSAGGSYTRAKRAVLMCDNPNETLHGGRQGRHLPALELYADLKFENVSNAQIVLDPEVWPKASKPVSLRPAMKRASVPADADPIAPVAGRPLCVGFVDDTHCIVPSGFVLAEIDGAWFYRIFTGATRRWQLAPKAANDPADPEILQSDTGQLVWNARRGLFTINTAATQGAVGFFGDQVIELDNVRLEPHTRFGSIVVFSTDFRPIDRSCRLLIAAVARCENTGQVWDIERTTIEPDGRGRAPVLVEPVEANVTLRRSGRGGPIVVRPLDSRGLPKGERIVEPGPHGAVVSLDAEQATVYYSVEYPSGD